MPTTLMFRSMIQDLKLKLRAEPGGLIKAPPGGASHRRTSGGKALMELGIADYAPKDEQDQMIAAIDRMMTKGRGFLQFEAYDKFLVDLYRNRKPGQTDLYPQIIEWFEENN